MLLTDDSYYSATYPHSPSHRHPRVTKIDGGREKRPPTPSETRQGGIHRAVVRSPAVAIARRAQARPMPQGPHPGRGPGRQRCCPPLPPARAEPRPPRPVPSSLDHRTPHPCQDFREPPRPPPSPTATTMPTTSAALTPRGTRCQRTTSRWGPSPRCCCPCRPGREGV